jgi:hypothetical protein
MLAKVARNVAAHLRKAGPPLRRMLAEAGAGVRRMRAKDAAKRGTGAANRHDIKYLVLDITSRAA